MRLAIAILPLVSVFGCGGNGGSGMQPSSTPTVTSVTLTPGDVTIEVGATQQFSATVVGSGSFDRGVTWSVDRVPSGNASVGTISDAGVYTTPFPAPARVTVTATSKADASRSGSGIVTIAPKAPGVGPQLAVNAASGRHPISPLIYGMNNYGTNFAGVAPPCPCHIERWGGDATNRYNYDHDIYNVANDFFSSPSRTATRDTRCLGRERHDRATRARDNSARDVPLIGWTTRRERTCSFSVAKYARSRKRSVKRGLRQWR